MSQIFNETFKTWLEGRGFNFPHEVGTRWDSSKFWPSKECLKTAKRIYSNWHELNWEEADNELIELLSELEK